MAKLVGETFGKLLVIARAGSQSNSRGEFVSRWLCRCIGSDQERYATTEQLERGVNDCRTCAAVKAECERATA